MKAIIAQATAVTTTIDSRLENFIRAYRRIGYAPDAARSLGKQRLQQDDEAVFQVEGCTDFKSAQETIWLMEAATFLCGGDLFRADAIELTEKALAGIKAL